jgi:two-component system CitB family sensor kinase
MALIGQESKGIQDLVQLLVTVVPDPIVAGCILGKFNRARELGLELIVDKESQMVDIPKSIPRDKLVTLIGNLLDNAFEATRVNTTKDDIANRNVTLSMSDYGDDLIFEIDDNGKGISDEDKGFIFDKGVSSKVEEGHGYGLYLVSCILKQLHGEMTLRNLDAGGSRAIVYLPKNINLKTREVK